MTIEERYLLCRTGRYMIAVPLDAVLRIWRTETPDPSYSAKPIDLRLLFGNASADAGVAIAFEMSDRIGVLVVDAVSGMASIAEDEFVELPPVFGFARQFFDAACHTAVDGAYPLRLVRQPILPVEGLSDPL
jgi:hypothetical protein